MLLIQSVYFIWNMKSAIGFLYQFRLLASEILDLWGSAEIQEYS